eukprot:1446089-Pyramimonas_sp.AAC.1
MRLIWARGYYTPRLLGAPSLYAGKVRVPLEKLIGELGEAHTVAVEPGLHTAGGQIYIGISIGFS